MDTADKARIIGSGKNYYYDALPYYVIVLGNQASCKEVR